MLTSEASTMHPLMFSLLCHQVKTVRLCWHPAAPGPVKMVEYVRSLKITRDSPASALKDGKVPFHLFTCKPVCVY